MDRRTFLAGAAAGIAAMPRRVRAQATSMPTIGFLRSTPAAPFGHLVTAFREGLQEEGFVEGTNVAIDYRWADNQLDRLPALASDLVRRQVAVIVGNSQAVEAARSATARIPIVFVTADDPVKRGLVASLSRPGGNLTGITFFGGGLLGAKRIELLHELVPRAAVVAFLMDPNWPAATAELADAEAAARALGLRVVIAQASGEADFEAALTAITKGGARALLVGGSPVFTSERKQLVAQVAQRALPAIYDQRDFVAAGGLMSYAASFTGAYRQAGAYAGRILKGAKPADLPVLQPTTFALALNLGTAKALGLEVPQATMLRAEELIR